MNLWLKDPVSGDRSITLTYLTVAFISGQAAGWLQAFGKISAPGVDTVVDMFYGLAVLYFSRRNIKIGGKLFGADVQQEEVKK